ncbi:hypothetical protein [Clostridium sp.]|jgi:hypothetical protein|uniref:hypothetical protein n=1 Tax=Clostridium sp. TaxID=1506 RepID=UPI003EEE996E
MGYNRTLSGVFVILSIVTFIACLLLNFVEFQDGSSASIRSVIITLWYATVWILVLVTGIMSRNRGAVKYCSIFWFITFISSFLGIYANINMVHTVGRWTDLIFPLYLLSMSQWYGLMFFVHSDITYFILIAVISLVMLAIAVIWLKRNKNK